MQELQAFQVSAGHPPGCGLSARRLGAAELTNISTEAAAAPRIT